MGERIEVITILYRILFWLDKKISLYQPIEMLHIFFLTCRMLLNSFMLETLELSYYAEVNPSSGTRQNWTFVKFYLWNPPIYIILLIRMDK